MAPSHHRWIVLASDGRHTTIGRDTAPDDVEVAAAGAALARIGLTGWLVRLEGDYWSRRNPVVLTLARLWLLTACACMICLAPVMAT